MERRVQNMDGRHEKIDNDVEFEFYDDMISYEAASPSKKYPLTKEQKQMKEFSSYTDEERTLFQKLQPYDINNELHTKLKQQKKYCMFYKQQNAQLKNDILKLEQSYEENKQRIEILKKDYGFGQKPDDKRSNVTYSNSNVNRQDPWGAELARRRHEIRNQKNENARLRRELDDLLKVQENVEYEKMQRENEYLKAENLESTQKVKDMQMQINQLKEIMMQTMNLIE